MAADYIAQALDILVDNGIDFAAPDTPIVLKLRRLDNFQIDVINLGSRLPESMAERIFEPLVSLGRKDAQKISLGMGLYIVKLIASFHGGDIIARNLLSSDGVIFSLSLPVHNASLLTNYAITNSKILGEQQWATASVNSTLAPETMAPQDLAAASVSQKTMRA